MKRAVWGHFCDKSLVTKSVMSEAATDGVTVA